jgi:zinc protease
MAAGLGAQVDKEMTCFAGTVHKGNLADWYRLAGEQLLHPGWREADFKRLKTQHINAIRTDLCADNDEELGKEALYQFIYGPDHPYGSYNLGAVGDLESIRLDDVKAFYRRYYTPANLVLGLAGDYGQDFTERAKRDAARLPASESAMIELPEPLAIHGREALIIQKQTPAVAVSFGFPIRVKRGDPDWVALWLVRSWLGEHRASVSHLYQRIREVRGMNYGDYAYIEYFPHGMFAFHPDTNLARRQQIFQIWLRPLRDNNDAQFATRAAMFELQKLIDNGLGETDFEATRRYLDNFVSLLVKTQLRQLGYRIDSAFYGIDVFTNYVRTGLEKLTLADVNHAIEKHLQTADVKFVFVAQDAGDLKSRLVSDKPSPIEYNSKKPDALLKEDKAIEALPLKFDGESVRIVPVEQMFS